MLFHNIIFLKKTKAVSIFFKWPKQDIIKKTDTALKINSYLEATTMAVSVFEAVLSVAAEAAAPPSTYKSP